MMNPLRLYHTIRYLTPRQVVGQLRHRLRARLESPARWLGRPAPAYPGCGWRPVSPFLASGAQVNRAGEILIGRLTFLNQAQTLGWPPDWERAGLPRLWLYNLHYFEWLWAFAGTHDAACEAAPPPAAGYPPARAAVLDWIARHGLTRGRVGWEPYPTSLRLMNWCCFFFERYRDRTLADKAFLGPLWASLRLQADWLTGHLESHLLGNHLLENGAALALAGACFVGPDAARWRATGLAVLREQIPEQIPADGLHFERSPMYHARMTWLLLTLYATGHPQLQAVAGPPLPAMLAALACVCHPDGRIALLNDSAFDIYNEPRELFAASARLGLPGALSEPWPAGPWALPQAGYYGFRDGDGSYLVCDAGAIGPDYLPGHAHADTFSFELSLRGRRVVVDSGVHDYEWSEMRQSCRSTGAHNTVEIAGQDQAEVWGAFRVARRGYPRAVTWAPRPDGFTLSAWHDGYRRLGGRPVHQRTFSYQAGGVLTVTDRVTADRPLPCRTLLHLHPDCRVRLLDAHRAEVAFPAGQFQIRFHGPGRLECRDGWYCPQFYIRRKNSTLVFSWLSAEAPEIHFQIGVDLENSLLHSLLPPRGERARLADV